MEPSESSRESRSFSKSFREEKSQEPSLSQQSSSEIFGELLETLRKEDTLSGHTATFISSTEKRGEPRKIDYYQTLYYCLTLAVILLTGLLSFFIIQMISSLRLETIRGY